MNCRDVEELLGAYALEALDMRDAADVREHLAGCNRHPDAATLRSSASRLSALATPVLPPPALRDRVLRAVAESAQEPASPRALTPVSQKPQPQRTEPVPITVTRRRAMLVLAAAAAIVIAVAASAWAIGSNGRQHESVQQLASRATWVAIMRPTSGQGSATVVYFSDDKKALVATSGLNPLQDRGETYQLWAIVAGSPRSLGTIDVDSDGSAVIAAPFDATGVDTLAVTVEPAGGSPAPTSQPVMSAKV